MSEFETELDETPPDAPEEQADDDGDDDDFSYQFCIACGIEFGMPAHLHQQRQKDGLIFFCPNGHQQHYVDAIEKRLEAAQRDALKAKSRAEQLEAKLGAATREANKPEHKHKWWW